ncbi:MAG: hypothetical protein HGA49_06045 [Eubacteriaceae bacterium]|nr:hypothetical protein [Eubacteriaceae bacterium]
MDNIEILISDIAVSSLNNFLKNSLGVVKANVINSHFFNDKSNEDFEFFDEMNLTEYYSETRTGNLFISKLTLGIDISDVMIIISSENMKADIELSFGEDVFENSSENEIKSKVIKLVKFLQVLNKEFPMDQITVGFEPISDTELNLLVINNKEICVCTEMDDILSNLIKNDICWDEVD